MKIIVDATPVVARRKGIGVVLEGLIAAVPRGSLLSNATFLVDAAFARENPGFFAGRSTIPVAFRSSLWFESVQVPALLSRHRADVFLTLRERTIVRRGTRSVVWLFEDPARREALAATTSKRTVGQQLVGRHAAQRLSRMATRVDHFIVSSDFTRGDLVRAYGVSPTRISVVYPGIDERFAAQAAPPESGNAAGGHRYVLHFATGDPRDNTDVAMRAFALATERSPAVHLVLAGVPEKEREIVAAKLEKLGIRGRTHVLGYVNAAAMPGLYAGAAAYLDPTLFEGFGLQILEAMSAGAPVVTSNVASVPEVAGNVAVLCDPLDAAGIAGELGKLLDDKEASARLISLGRKRAGEFTWAKTVAGIERVVQQL